MTRKTRVLFVGEGSPLSTGFSTYYRELLPRLVKTGKYEIAELGCYTDPNNPIVNEFIQGRWKFYGTMPTNAQENMAFQQPSNHPRDRGQNINQFGAWKFDEIVAEFKPDLVVDIRDNWMITWQLRSPFRSWFKLVWMPTVDAEPQQEEWIQDYEKADLILSYSDYGIDVLKRQSLTMKVLPEAMRPGVDTKTFFPMDHDNVREYWNVNKKIPIIGTVMRNQSRKLYPDLIDAFSHMKNKYKGEWAVDKSVLLIHSSWPDNMHSYDYPRHVMRLQSYPWMPYASKGVDGVRGIKDSVMQSLMCHNPDCKEKTLGYVFNLYGKPIQDGKIFLPCTACGQVSASCPTTGFGYSREELAMLYNLMDVYVQCSICVHPNTLVRTPSGMELIKSLKIGDEVLTHAGDYQTVTKTMSSLPNASVKELMVYGDNQPITITGNHPVLTKNGEWKRVDNLTKDDWLVYNFDKREITPSNVDLWDNIYIKNDNGELYSLSDRYYDKGKKITINTDSLKMTPELAYIMGLYIAEGSVSNHYISFTFHDQETAYHGKVVEFIRSLGKNDYSRNKKDTEHGFEITFSCPAISRKFVELFGESSVWKHIPEFLRLAPLSIQQQLIKGLFDGDGTYQDDVYRYYTSSKELAYQVRDILLRLNIVSSIICNSRHEYYVTIKENYSKWVFDRDVLGKHPPESPDKRDIFISLQDGVLYSRVRSINDSDYVGPVFNIEVENKKGGPSPDAHSYALASFTVHNCEGDG